MLRRVGSWFNSYKRTPVPSPGSGNLTYDTLALPYETPIGPGVANQRQFVVSGPVTYIPQFAMIADEYNGLLSGQMTYQPLVVVQPQNTFTIAPLAGSE